MVLTQVTMLQRCIFKTGLFVNMAVSMSGVAAISLFDLGARMCGLADCWLVAAGFSVWLPVLVLNLWLCYKCIAVLRDDSSASLDASTSAHMTT
jgi:hypothetical protein